MRSTTILGLLLALGSLAPAAVAEEPAVPVSRPAPVFLGEDRILLFLPGDRLYPPNTASPFESGFGVQLSDYPKVDIPGAGDNRVSLRFGGSFGLLRLASTARPERGLQLEIEAGFSGQFDNDYGQDNIGWDGYGGAGVTWAPDWRWVLRLGIHHTSSHFGDELLERTDGSRMDYVREELRAAVSVRLHPRLRLYVEGGWGFGHIDPDLQAPWRSQTGLVYEAPDVLWGGRFGWYAAADLAATEEREWRVDTALQIGLLRRTSGRSWRLGLEFYDGRPPIGEFFQATERHLAIGLWFDP